MGRDRMNDLEGQYDYNYDAYYTNDNNHRSNNNHSNNNHQNHNNRQQSQPAQTQYPRGSSRDRVARDNNGNMIPPSRNQSSHYNHNNKQNAEYKEDSYYHQGYPQSMSTKPSNLDSSHSAIMQSFMADVQTVKSGIEKIKQNMDTMEVLHRKALSATRPDDKNKISKQVESYQIDCSDLINSLRDTVKRLQNIANTQLSGSDQKICTTQTQGLAKKLMDVAQEYQRMQLKYKDKFKQRMEREIRVANPYATEQEVHQAVEAGGSGFAMQMMSSTPAQRQALKEVQSRHNEIMNIEKSVTELFDLFQEMQHLLMEQQEAIDIIESHVDNAEEHVVSGNSHMTKAIVHRKKSRKRMWWISACVIILLIALGLFIYFKFFR